MGVKPWESLAKARYIRELVDDGYSLPEVAHRVGSGKRLDVVRRWLLTLYSIEQANRESPESWDEIDERFGFSWLYTALGYLAVRDYLGITHGEFSLPKENPVPEDSVSNLLDHMKDLYGPPPGDPQKAVVRESRRIKDLAQVYANADAVAALRTSGSLQVALRKTVNEETQLIELLQEADTDLLLAKDIAANHPGHGEATKFALNCRETANAVVVTLEQA